MGKSWVIRDGSEKDLEAILSLRRLVFGEMERDKLDPRFWNWEFMESPEGKAFIYIVEDEGKVIGHFADIPKQFCVNGEAVRGTLSLDLMVHPNYRRKGIYFEVGKYAAQRVKENQGLFMTAFPIRPETITGLYKIGWRAVTELPVMVFPLRFSGMLKRYVRFSPLSLLVGGLTRCLYFLLIGAWRERVVEGSETEEVKEFDEEFDRFWQKHLSLYPVMGVRDRAFLEWRYLKNPARTYIIYRAREKGEMTGYLILRKVDLLNFNSAVIVDLLAFDEKTAAVLVEKGIERSREAGADLLGCMSPKRHPYTRVLRDRGFLPSRKTFLFMVYSHSEEKIPLTPEAWYVNWGDTDVI